MVAKASMKLFGMILVMNAFISIALAERPDEAPASGSGRDRPTPGCITLTQTMPSSSEKSDAVTNHPSALAPMRPTALESPVPAMPATMVLKTSGAMIILISRRNRSVTTLNQAAISLAASGLGASVLQRWPVMIPSNIAVMM